MPVARIARNLNATAATGTWSLRAPSGLVVGWCAAVEVVAGSFNRSECGFRKAAARGRRDVFAWVEGDVCRVQGFVANPKATGAREAALIASLLQVPGAVPNQVGRRVHFRPDLTATFAANVFRVDGAVVESADLVRCLPDAGCYIA